MTLRERWRRFKSGWDIFFAPTPRPKDELTWTPVTPDELAKRKSQ